jgi:hypothetical protein
MNLRAFIFATVLGAAATGWSQTYIETTRTESKPSVVTGEVVRLEPGKTIVVRSGGEEVAFVLAPGVLVPSEVQVGRAVTLHVEPSADGSATLVRRVVTTTVSSEGDVKRTTEETRTRPSTATTSTQSTTTTTTVPRSQTTTTTTTTASGTVTGEVVRFEPGKTIVIRSDGRETTYVLTPSVSVPAEVQVGRTATLQLEPGADGTSIVRRVTTTSVGADGQVRRTTEIQRTSPSGQTSTSSMTTVTGRVEAYVPGKSVTVVDPSGARVTYVLAAETQMPAEVIVGKEATIYAAPQGQPGEVTYEIEKDGDTIKIKAKTKRN